MHPFAQRAQLHYSQQQQQHHNHHQRGHYQQQVRGLLAQQQQQQNVDVVITSSRGNGVTISPSAETPASSAFSLPNRYVPNHRFPYDFPRRR